MTEEQAIELLDSIEAYFRLKEIAADENVIGYIVHSYDGPRYSDSYCNERSRIIQRFNEALTATLAGGDFGRRIIEIVNAAVKDGRGARFNI